MDSRSSDDRRGTWFRTQRFFSEGSRWYFSTREQTIEGPFVSRNDAEQELMIYLRNMRERANFGL